MYTKALAYAFLVGGLIMLGTGCSFYADAPTLTTVNPTLTHSLSTRTASRLSLATLSSTPVAATSSPALASTPTLTAQERQAQIVRLLKTNAGCRFPCWWGIMPGETLWLEAERFFVHLGVLADPLIPVPTPTKSQRDLENTPTSTKPTPNEGLITGPITHGMSGLDLAALGVYNSLIVMETNGTVDTIILHSEGHYGPDNFKTIYQELSPTRIIQTYGEPSRIWIRVRVSSLQEEPSDGSVPYSLALFYDNHGILLRYIGKLVYEDPYRMCPTFDDQGDLGPSLDVFLQSPSSLKSLEKLAGEKLGPLDDSLISLEKASGLSREVFAAILTQTSAPPCFEIPHHIWP